MTPPDNVASALITGTPRNADDVREQVWGRYAAAALAVTSAGQTACCAPSDGQC